MYSTSELYKEILNSNEQRYGSYIELEDGTKITSNDDLSGLKITETIGENLIGSFSPKIANINILDNKNYNLTDKKFKLFVGLYLNDTDVEYIPYGTFIVSKPTENDKATKEIALEAKDISYLFDTEYERKKFDSIFPCTVIVWLQEICHEKGIQLANIEFPNGNMVLYSQPYTEDGATYRNVVSKIAEACASFAKIGRDDQLYLKKISNSIEISKKIILNTLFEQKKDDLTYGPINSIVASRVVADDGSTTEDVYVKDEDSIRGNGLCEYKIKENWIIDDNREEFIENILESMKGTSFNTGNIDVVADPSIDVGDYIEVSDVENDTSFILLVMNNELDANTYINTIESSMPSETETDYNSATTSKKDRIRKTELKINKLNGEITSIIEEQTEFNNKLTETIQDVNSIKDKVSEISDFTREKTETNQIYIDETIKGQGYVLEFKIKGDTTNFKYLTPSDTLTPDDNLVPLGGCFTIVCDSQSRMNMSNEAVKINVNLAEPLRNLDDTYDEINIVDGITKVTRRIGVDENLNLYELDEEIIETLDDVILPTFDDNTYIYIKEYEGIEYSIKYIVKSEYSDSFITKKETNSMIEQTSKSITENVEANYTTKDEMITEKSERIQSANEIIQTVSKKVGEDEIISKINQSPETVGIDADKIELSANDVLNLLSGNTINLSGKNIKISSESFNVDANGKMTCSNAIITGGKIQVSGSGSASDLLVVKNSSNSSEKSYIQPVGAGFVGSSGRIDIMAEGSSASSSIIDVSGSDGTSSIRSNGITTPTLTQTSLESIKKNITKVEETMSIIEDTDIYTYNLKNEEDGDKKHFGFIIGKNYKTPEEVIAKSGEGIDIYSMTSVLWKAVQELNKKIHDLEQEVRNNG